MKQPLFDNQPATLGEILQRRAGADPERLAFAAEDGRLTCRELLEEATTLAGRLAASGVEGGDRVALYLPAGLDFVRAFWAVQLLGATSCALNPNTPFETVRRRAARVRPAAILTLDALRELPAAAPFRRDTAVPDDLAVLQPTSGTSGESRAAMIRHRNLEASLRSGAEGVDFGPHDVFVAWVPPWHDLGLVRFVIGSVYYGAPCHIVSPAITTIPRWLSTVAAVGGTVTGAPDFAYRLAVRMVPPGLDLGSLRFATNGGEPVRRSTIGAFAERFGTSACLPGYGLAEATLGVTCVRPGQPLRFDERGNVSCGVPFPDVEVRTADDGEILVKGPAVFAGYFDAEALNAEVLRDGWLHTGDTGYLAGGELYVLGRKRALLKRGGAALAPRELEEAAHEVEGVKVAAAVSIAAASTEEIIVVVEAEGDPAWISREVARAIQRALGFAPERVLVVAPRTIPRTWNGKIRHAALREAVAAGTLQPLSSTMRAESSSGVASR